MNRFITLFLYVSHIYSVNQCQFTFATPPPFCLIYTLSYERNPTALILSTILPPIKLYFTFSKMISSAAPVAKAVVCHSTLKKWQVHGNQLLFLDDRNSEIHGFIPAGRRYHQGSVHQCVELPTIFCNRNFSLRSQLAAEQSRCFKLEVAEVSGTGQSYSRTEEINNAFANEVSWDRSSMSSTQAPTHRPSKRTYGAIQTVNFLCLRFCLSQW
ncbi:unnamed protein product [Brassica rapa subsp. narinosa]|uniref:(rape) hypothetical protein n=1 Tax=Brassica napus TaxID=3708 RepID=A0A817AQD7_BRANA|nr:unnamed protein product [Brassica napus]